MFSQLSSKILLAGLLIPLAAWANDKSPPDAAHSDKDAGLEAQLDDARHRLEEAAHEVAVLSSQLGGPLVERFSTFDGAFGRAIIGVQLDPSSGKDGARVVSVSPGGPAAEAGIRAQFGVSHAALGWLVSSYLIAMAVGQPIGMIAITHIGPILVEGQ